MHVPLKIICVSLAAVVAWGAISFSGFVADDAYIVFRYAENLIDHGALVYNLNEPVSALTSPLHALIVALLYTVTDNTVLAYQAVGFLAYLFTALVIWQVFTQHPGAQLLALALVCLPPGVLLWAFGGLETPLLMLTVAAASALVYRHGATTGAMSQTTLTAILALAGIAFLLRFDSALFFAPLVMAGLLRTTSWRSATIAIAVGASVPLIWCVFAYQYYGDVLPTSFYEKTPRLSRAVVQTNLIYTVNFLVCSGIAVALVLPFLVYSPVSSVAKVWARTARANGCLWVGLALVLMYGLTMATSHMMFSFRYFVPYIPAAAISVVAVFVQARNLTSRSYVLLAAVGSLIIFQAYQFQVTSSRSLNGLATIGEFRGWGVEQYNAAMEKNIGLAIQIKSHWKTHGDSSRPPRINTFAAGLLPYAYRDAYIYALLVSYRHCKPAQQMSFDECGTWGYEQTKKWADYTVLLYPLYGDIDEQLPFDMDDYTVVADQELIFDGTRQRVRVLFNADPLPHGLSNNVKYFYRDESQ